MIKIDTEPVTPKVHNRAHNQTNHVNQIKDSLENLEKKSTKHEDGDFKSSLWGKYKKQLHKIQKGKCAYCERCIDIGESRLDHYRPKNKIKNFGDGKVQKVGYWWLAYDWKNFLILCEICNNRKSNYFPLSDEKKRETKKGIKLAELAKLDDTGTLGEEEPLLINPRFHENPELLFTYNTRNAADEHNPEVYICASEPDEPLGSATIKICDLNRLRTKRAEIYNQLHQDIEMVKELKATIKILSTSLGVSSASTQILERIEDTKKELKRYEHKISNMSKKDSPFSGLVRWYLTSENQGYLIKK